MIITKHHSTAIDIPLMVIIASEYKPNIQKYYIWKKE